MVHLICWFSGNRRSAEGIEDTIVRCSMYLSDCAIDPSAIGGIVRIPESLDPRSTMGSATSGLMFRPRNARLLPAEGFGGKRALKVMISVDKALNGKRAVVSEEDARKLRMDKCDDVTLMWIEHRPPIQVRFDANSGRPLRSGSRTVVPHDDGPHKVRLPKR